MHEETFGPVLPVVAFDTLEEAISMANDSDYGLTSSIYTQNLNVAMKAIKGLKFGETYINRETSKLCKASTLDGVNPVLAAQMVNMACMNICRPRWFIYSRNE